MRLRISIRGRVRPSVCPVFSNDEYALNVCILFEIQIYLSNDIIINDTMSNDEVVASDVPLLYLLLLHPVSNSEGR